MITKPDNNTQDPCVLPIFSTDFNDPLMLTRNQTHYINIMRKLEVIPKRLIAPMFVLFDITSDCNLRCSYCYNKSGDGNHIYMDRKTIFRIAEELVQMKVFSVCVCGGEPTLHPDYIDLIRYLREKGILVASITNGYNLDDEVIKEMAANLAILQVTLDGPNAEIHDQLRGRGSFEQAMKTIERLKYYNLHQLRIAFTCTSRNIRYFPEMLDLCLQIGANDLRTMQLVPVGRAFRNKKLWANKNDLEMVKNQIEAWTKDEKVISKISIEWGSPHEHIKIGLLYGYLLGVNISPEGYYKISPYLPIAFGNAYRVTLSSAWRQGLGMGWNLPKAKEIFESINSVDDYANAYDIIIKNENLRDGYIDLFREEDDSRK